MSFLNPLFLLSLLAVGLPVVIHLLNIRKPRRVKFSTLAFFQELQKTTIKRIRIKQFILLALRVAAVVSFAMVLARPFLPPGMSMEQSASTKPAVIGIMLDNSISMERIGRKGPLLLQAQQAAEQMLEQAGNDDRFLIQKTNGEALKASLLSKSEAADIIKTIKAESAANFGTSRLPALIEAIENAPLSNKKLFVITDGQPSQFSNFDDFGENTLKNMAFSVVLMEDSDVQNTYLQQLRTPSSIAGVGNPFIIIADIKNEGSRTAANQFVSLEINGVPSGQFPVELAPNAQESFSFEVIPQSTGHIKGRLIIEGDEFVSDNSYYFSLAIPKERKVLWVVDSNKPNLDFSSYTGVVLEAAKQTDSQLTFEKAGNTVFNTADYSKYDAILLDGLAQIPEFAFTDLIRFVQNGKGLLFFPAENGDIQNYNAFLSQFSAGSYAGIRGDYASFESISKIRELPVGHPVLQSVFDENDRKDVRINPPDVYYHYVYRSGAGSNGLPLLRTNLGEILLYEQPFGEGRFIISALGNDPGWSNLPVNPVFVPLYYRTVLYASSVEDAGFKTEFLTGEKSFTLPAEYRAAEFSLNGEQVLPQSTLLSGNAVLSYHAREWNPGWLEITAEGLPVIAYGINIPTDESGTQFSATDKNLYKEKWLALGNVQWIDQTNGTESELLNAIKSAGFGIEIWYWFMWAGLVFLLIETAVTIWYKAESM